MTRYSASRDVLYSTPPGPDEEPDDAVVAEADTDAENEPAAADD